MNILLKRILAGSFDLAIITAITSTLSNFISRGSYSDVVLLLLYSQIITQYRTTPGGIIFGLKIAPISGGEMTKFKPVLRALILYPLLIPTSLVLTLKGAAAATIAISVTFIINAIPTFFTAKKLMLHDIISRSFVEIDTSNRFTPGHKSYLWMGFTVSLCLILIMFYGSSQDQVKKPGVTTACVDLYNKEQYKRVVDECLEIATKTRNPDLNLKVGHSYIKLENYDAAIEHLTIAQSTGDKLAPLLILFSNIQKGNADDALKIMEGAHEDSRPFIPLFKSHAYFVKFLQSKNTDDLLKAAAYLQVSDRIAQAKNIDMENASTKLLLTWENFQEYKRTINLAVDQNLSTEQKAKLILVIEEIQSPKFKK